MISVENGNKELVHQISTRGFVVFKNYGKTDEGTFCKISPSSVCLRLDIS